MYEDDSDFFTSGLAVATLPGGSLLDAAEMARRLEASLPEPLFRPGDIIHMNGFNMNRLGGPLQEAYPHNIFKLSPHLPNEILSVLKPTAPGGGLPSARIILIKGENEEKT